MSTTRRTVIRGIATLPLLPACKGTPAPLDTGVEPLIEDPRADWPSVDWQGAATPSDLMFPIGVQSGDPTPDGARLWTAFSGAGDLVLYWAVWDGASWLDAGSEPVTRPATTRRWRGRRLTRWPGPGPQ